MILFRFRDRRPVRKARPPLARIAKARTVRPFPGDDWWEALQRIADDAVPGVREAFLAAIATLVDAVSLEAIEAALADGDIGAAIAAIPWETLEESLAPMRVQLEEIFDAAIEVSRQSTLVHAGLELAFDVPNRYAIEWARQHVGELIVGVSHETRTAIREVIARQLETGMHPMQSARLIRPMIGLTRRHSAAVNNLRARLVEDGVPPQQIDRLVDQYRRRLLNLRAQNIARTETMAAANAGHRALWQSAVDNGLINAEEWEREWVAVVPDPDARTCAVCRALDDQRAPVGGTFGGGLDGPPAHPSCRCVERLVPREAAPGAADGPAPEAQPEPPAEVAVPEAQAAEQRAANLDQVEQRIAALDRENLVALDADGNIVLDRVGAVDHVQLTEQDIDQLAGRGLTLTHNHPTAPVSFSIEDIAFAMRIDAAEMRAVTSRWTYSMSPGPTGWGSIDRANAVISRHFNEVAAEFAEARKAGQLTRSVAERIFMHEIWQRSATELGWRYTRTAQRRR